MVRTLSEKDITLLSKMSPEFDGESCRGSGAPYRSLLPPIANHYSQDAEDFKARIERLTDEDFNYLVGLILDGEESLHCIPPEYYSILEEKIAKKLGEVVARKVSAFYAMSCE